MAQPAKQMLGRIFQKDGKQPEEHRVEGLQGKEPPEVMAEVISGSWAEPGAQPPLPTRSPCPQAQKGGV